MFCCEFCEIFENNVYKKHLWTTASANATVTDKIICVSSKPWFCELQQIFFSFALSPKMEIFDLFVKNTLVENKFSVSLQNFISCLFLATQNLTTKLKKNDIAFSLTRPCHRNMTIYFCRVGVIKFPFVFVE